MKARIDDVSDMVITPMDPKPSASMAYRVLRSNLEYICPDRPLKSLVLSSAVAGEGKTTCICNLAVAFAETGVRVCLVDANLRNPAVANKFGVGDLVGLTTVLIGQETLDAALRQTYVSGITLLPSGALPPNPTELLASQRMTRLLGELEERFDMVLVDTPPVLGVPDTVALATKAGGVLLVVRAGKTAYQQVNRAKEALAATKAQVFGVVLTGIEAEE